MQRHEGFQGRQLRSSNCVIYVFFLARLIAAVTSITLTRHTRHLLVYIDLLLPVDLPNNFYFAPFPAPLTCVTHTWNIWTAAA